MTKITATEKMGKEEIRQKEKERGGGHDDFDRRIQKLESAGVIVEFGVGAESLDSRYAARAEGRAPQFDSIICLFSFVAGESRGDLVPTIEILGAFFRAARKVLSDRGRIVVTLRVSTSTRPDYYPARIRLGQLATRAGLRRVNSDGPVARMTDLGHQHTTTSLQGRAPRIERAFVYVFEKK